MVKYTIRSIVCEASCHPVNWVNQVDHVNSGNCVIHVLWVIWVIHFN